MAIQTMEFNEEAGGRVVLSGGSFDTPRAGTVEHGWGWFGLLHGRPGLWLSDGYADRSASDLSSMQLGLGYRGPGQIAYSAMLGTSGRSSLVRCAPHRIGRASRFHLGVGCQFDEYGYGADSARIEDLIPEVASTTTTTTPIRWTITAKITIRFTQPALGGWTWEPRCTTRRERALRAVPRRGRHCPLPGNACDHRRGHRCHRDCDSPPLVDNDYVGRFPGQPYV